MSINQALITEKVILDVDDRTHPYYVGARAYVTQIPEGAIVTVIDKFGKTEATLLDGNYGNITDVTYDPDTKTIKKVNGVVVEDLVTLSDVAISNDYDDLDNLPTIPSTDDIEGVVEDWINENPVPNVCDGSITEQSLDPSLAEKTINKNDFYTDKTDEVKTSSQTVDGHTYVAFSAGTVFKGKEIYANRYGYEHVADDDNDYGKIGFVTRDADTGEFSAVTYLSVDSSIQAFDLRDPNLVVLDGYEDYLIMSCFGLIHNAGGVVTTKASFMFVLDSELNVLSWCQINGTLFWGNTLLSPDGYIIHASYENGVFIYKSDTQFNGSFSGVTFSNVATVNSKGAEPTIGYINDLLLCFIRVDGEKSLISKTDNLEGTSGWGTPIPQQASFYAPCIPTSYKGRFCPFSATEQNRVPSRYPLIGAIDMFDLTVSDYAYVDDKLFSVRLGGYTTLVPLGDGVYGVMWFMEYPAGNSTYLLYKRVNLNYFDRYPADKESYRSATIISNNQDCNNMTAPSAYLSQSGSTSATLLNCPTTVAFRMDVEYLNNRNNIRQLIRTAAEDVYYRTGTYSGGTWTFKEWNIISTNTKAYDHGVNGGNCNNAKLQGLLYRTTTSSTNSPVSGQIFIIEYKKYDENNGIQFAYGVGVSTPDIYARTYSSGSWGSWHKVDVTSL